MGSWGKTFALLLVLVFIASSCLIFDRTVSGATASENTWVEKKSMLSPRSGVSVATVNGRLYAIGGINLVATGGSDIFPAEKVSGGIMNENEEYDPSANNWTMKAPIPNPRISFAIAAYQNKIYCIGGVSYVGANNFTDLNEVYDTQTNTWSTKSPMPTGRDLLQANVVNGKIYCIGGLTSSGSYTNVNEVYDPTTNTWITKSPALFTTSNYVSAVIGSKIYIIGGYNGFTSLNQNQIYDTQNDTWSSGAPSPNGVGAGGATIGVMAPERIYCFGGLTQIYDPENNSWSFGAKLPISQGGYAVGNVNDLFYIIGGSTYTTNLNGDLSTEAQYPLNWQYTPFSYGTPDPFYVMAHTPPKIYLQSPLNQSYGTGNVSLVFAADKTVNWTGYSLDGRRNITITGNTTLTELSSGLHNITVYSNDTFGNMGASENVTFRISSPFPILTVVSISGVMLVVVVAALLVYLKKHKHKAV